MLEQVIEILNAKYNLLLEFEEINDKQKQLLTSSKEDIENFDDDSLLDYSSKKNDIINNINQLDEKFVEDFEQIKKEAGGGLDELIKNPEFATLQKKIKDIFYLVSKISDKSNENIKSMEDTFDYIKNELKDINDKKSPNKYVDRPVTDLEKGYFMDEKK